MGVLHRVGFNQVNSVFTLWGCYIELGSIRLTACLLCGGVT